MSVEPSTKTLWFAALPAFPLALLQLPFYILIPAYYAGVVGLPLALVGYALLSARLIDALLEPLIGWLSDKTNRKFWMMGGAVVAMIASWMIFNPNPLTASPLKLAGWGTLLTVGVACISVPYWAWSAQLSSSYEGRNRVATFRESMGLIGTLMALVLIALASSQGGQSDALFAASLLLLALLPLCIGVMIFKVAEPKAPEAMAPPFWASMKALLRNRAFRQLLLAFFVNGAANAIPATLFLFYAKHRLGAEDSAGLLLLLYFVCAMVGLPLWLYLGRFYRKNHLWCAAMLLACCAFLPAAFLSNGDVFIFGIICVVSGLTLGADLVLPSSIQADLIAADAQQSGEQRAGLYLATWSLATKFALAVAPGVVLPVLAFYGFDPTAQVTAEASGVVALGFFYAGAPVLLKLCAIILMARLDTRPA